jgi:small subunit ribosomal protein S20
VNVVPNIKSAKKRVKVTRTKHLRNRAVKSNLKTTLKKFDAAVNTNVEEAAAILPSVSSTIDKAVAKGVMHKNTANRRKAAIASKLSKAQNA